MRILITGVAGFAGRHLLNYIQQALPDAEIHGTAVEQSARQRLPQISVHILDLRDFAAVRGVIAGVRPDQVYHLAAQASPRISFLDPWETLENNIRAQLNLIQACLAEQIKPRFLVVSSAEVYGPVTPEQLPIHEDTPLRPASPYGVSKVAQDMLGLQYFLSHQFPVVRARPFNHFGPGQREGFVAPDFAMQIARIEAGQQPAILTVGNLSAERDLTDVRDVIRAYWLMMTNGTAGEVYNVASGRAYSMQRLLDTLLSYSQAHIEVRNDPARMKPADIPIMRGDSTRLSQTLGWQAAIPFEQTVYDVLQDCRQRVRPSPIGQS